MRGHGVGSRLMAYAETVCRQDGARDIFLCVSSFNPRASALYERLGYKLVGELTDFVIGCDVFSEFGGKEGRGLRGLGGLTKNESA